MPEEQSRIETARAVCRRFLDLRQATTEHQLLITFADPALLQNMEFRSQLRVLPNRTEFLPSVGSFALLGDDDEMYQRVRSAYELVVHVVWNLYYTDGDVKEYQFQEFLEYANSLYKQNPVDSERLRLGLYIHLEFAALFARRVSEDRMSVESLSPSKHVVTMKKDPLADWNYRVEASRSTSTPMIMAPFPSMFGHDAETEEMDFNEPTPDSGFWSLIHPAVTKEAYPRYRNHQYADAIQSALKVVAQAVRDRTGLQEDGSPLMQRAFSPQRPRLIFEDRNPNIQKDMQLGYMNIFAGTMTGIRNPKAHALINIDKNRCIHFLFLASLLTYRADEAIAAPDEGGGEPPNT